jgi:hypothetical protein
MEFQHKFLAQPSPEDSRDYPVTAVAPKLNIFPDHFKIPYNGEIKNQGEIGSCVAHSISYTREMQEEKQSGSFKRFSVGFIYGNRRASDMKEEGMYPREALSNLVEFGDVPYELFPYNATYPEVSQKLSLNRDKLFQAAKPYRVSTYFRINDTDELKSALMNVGPVTGCFPIWESMYSVTKERPEIPMPPATQTPHNKFLGYHEMTVVGWREDGKLIILNSWGSDWADDGYAYMDPNYPIAELWGITDTIVNTENVKTGNSYFTLLVEQLITIKDMAFSFADSLKQRGFKEAYVYFNAELKSYEIHVGYFCCKEAPEVRLVQQRLASINVPTSLVMRG